MGIGSTIAVQDVEDEIKEQTFESIVYEAAHYAVNDKMPREEAFNTSKYLHERRCDDLNYIVTNDELMQIEYLDTALVEPSFERTRQIEAVAQELRSQFDYEQ